MNAGKAANRIRELEEALSAKDAELAALRGELAEAKQETERIGRLAASNFEDWELAVRRAKMAEAALAERTAELERIPLCPCLGFTGKHYAAACPWVKADALARVKSAEDEREMLKDVVQEFLDCNNQNCEPCKKCLASAGNAYSAVTPPSSTDALKKAQEGA